MELTPFEIACIAGGFGIVGSLVGSITTHFLSKDITRRNEFNKAAAEFKSAFIPELRYLDYRYSPDRMNAPGIYKILSLAFDRHEIAVIKFRPYLNCRQCIDFNKAWEDYCDKKEDSKPHFIVYAEPEGVIDRIKAQKFYLEKLNNLLKFTDSKH